MTRSEPVPPVPRVFFLGGKLSREIPREHWEQRREPYDDPRYRERAVEIAPGVFAAHLGHGDFILPGQVVGAGAGVAVWNEGNALSEAVRLLEEVLHLRQNGERAPGGNETWADLDRKVEEFLRGLGDQP